ncbi:MAG: hypothetical protein HYX89_00990 [Chloroflexi bacterium]|nr:hypothetical protein [Chloroflexota bacterium]
MARQVTEVLEPIGRASSVRYPTAPRLGSLNGTVVGLLFNSKTNGDVILERLAHRLSERFQLIDIVHANKTHAGYPASDALIEELLERSQVVLTALGD